MRQFFSLLIAIVIFSLITLFSPVTLYAQAPVNYDDVLLLININDTNSVCIGEYFAAQRDFRERNILRLDVPAKETIRKAEFDDLRAQVENYLQTTGLDDSINYFVTTKGVPLRLEMRDSVNTSFLSNASVDSELMLILGRYSPHIAKNTLFISSSKVRVHGYWQEEEHYARKNKPPGSTLPYDLFLTTRLTGLTKEDVVSLIDRSGPHTFVDKDSALFVFDRDPRPIQLNPYDANFADAGQRMAAKGWNTLVNSDSVFVTHQRNVICYGSWGSNDHYDHHYTEHARPKNHWLPGSVAETYVSTSARNFRPGATAGQSRIADLIAEGCTGASGYVYEPYTVALTWVNLLSDRYTSGYNLAESYYMSNPTYSWMAVVVGDPKTSIITEFPPVPSPVVDVPEPLCEGRVVTLHARNAIKGNMNWFKGDFASVSAAGLPFDERHPAWMARDSIVARLMTEAGDHRITFINENFIGYGYSEITVRVLPLPVAAFEISADTLYLDEGATAHFTDLSQGVTTWEWSFGDGTATSEEENPKHTYTETGSFTITLTVSNGSCSANAKLTIVVRDSRTTAITAAPVAPTGMQLHGNHPNPFLSSTTISFSLSSSADVRLEIFDALGRQMAVLLNKHLSPGRYSPVWHPSGLQSGMYYYRLEAAGQVLTGNLTLLR